MSNFTEEQKNAFLILSKKYALDVYQIVSRGDSTDVDVLNEGEAILLDQLSSRICDLVIRDYPDDEDMYADAEMIAFMISDILSESGFEI